MKKLIFIAVFTLGSLNAFAQGQETGETKEQTTEPHEQAQNKSKEIALKELPQALMDAVNKNFPAATINKAYTIKVKNKRQYKIDVFLEDGTTTTMFLDEQGNPIEM